MRDQLPSIEEVIASIRVYLKNNKLPAVELSTASNLDESIGLDSLAKFELLIHLENNLAVTIDPEVAGESGTLMELYHCMSVDESSAVGIADFEQHLANSIPQLLVDVDDQQQRSVLVNGEWVDDFASANYLGLDLHPAVVDCIDPAVRKWGVHPSWTRVVASPGLYNELEQQLARFTGAPETLVFPTVTLLHIGLLPLLVGADEYLLLDERAHHSMQEAALIVKGRDGKIEHFPHNDMDALEELLAQLPQEVNKIIAVDGIYSMTGGPAALVEIVELCKFYNARVYVDDAHGFGVIGEQPDERHPYGRRGNGLVRHLDLDYEDDRIIYVGGMSKAFSSLTAFVTCISEEEKKKFCEASTWIFSGPSPTASLASSIAGISISDSAEGDSIRHNLYALTDRLVQGAEALGYIVENDNCFPLASVFVGSVQDAIKACQILWEYKVLITPAVFPNVPMNESMLRFTLTAANTHEQVENVISALSEIRDALPNIPYNDSNEVNYASNG